MCPHGHPVVDAVLFCHDHLYFIQISGMRYASKKKRVEHLWDQLAFLGVGKISILNFYRRAARIDADYLSDSKPDVGCLPDNCHYWYFTSTSLEANITKGVIKYANAVWVSGYRQLMAIFPHMTEFTKSQQLEKGAFETDEGDDCWN
eukprot:TRINITY_DN3852_c0_g6_i2.p1 TRINITY_DN3852_c0_g6~~TRINITY_DN3852_c0_g6_i2.p1  ORF type:complete len:147 (+),score=21.81 TRINITY_DN3852_c0_g6_i2:309-749(+)